MIRQLVLAGLSGLCAASAWAGDLSVTITTPDGKPLADAVVTAPAPKGSPMPAFPWKLAVQQINKQFEPFVLIAPVGAEVAFPNLDKFRHHVYSFSKGNKFELELFGREDRRSYTFKTVGVAALGCNIHDEMVAFVRVVDTPFAAKSQADGVARITGLPAGPAQITVWHPHAKGRTQTVTATVTIHDSGPAQLTVIVDIAPPRSH